MQNNYSWDNIYVKKVLVQNQIMALWKIGKLEKRGQVRYFERVGWGDWGDIG